MKTTSAQGHKTIYRNAISGCAERTQVAAELRMSRFGQKARNVSDQPNRRRTSTLFWQLPRNGNGTFAHVHTRPLVQHWGRQQRQTTRARMLVKRRADNPSDLSSRRMTASNLRPVHASERKEAEGCLQTRVNRTELRVKMGGRRRAFDQARRPISFQARRPWGHSVTGWRDWQHACGEEGARGCVRSRVATR